MVSLKNVKNINELIKKNSQKKDKIDKKTMLKLKLKVWDKIQTTTTDNNQDYDENQEFKPTMTIISSFLEELKKKEEWSLNRIVDEGLCAKCGTCSIVCPKQIVVLEDYPFLKGRCERKGYGTCYEVCPRINTGSYKIRSLLNLHNEYYKTDMFSSKLQETANHILVKLIEDKKIDGAIFVGNYKWKPVSMIVTDKEYLEDNTKEQYAISTLDAIHEAGYMGIEKIAVIGLPCQIAGLRNIQYFKENTGHSLQRTRDGKKTKLPKIEYLIGLFCKGKYEHEEMYNILEEKSVDIEEVTQFEVNEFDLTVHTNNDKIIIDYDEIHPSSGCMICKDFDSELADISLGRAGSDENHISIITRTEKGEELKEYLNAEKGLDFENLNMHKQMKIDRFNQEVDRRIAEEEYNTYYYIWKHPHCIPGQNGMIHILLPTPIAGYYDADTVIRIAEIAKKYDGEIKISNRENFHIENIHPKDIDNLFDDLYEIKDLLDFPDPKHLAVCPGNEFCLSAHKNTRNLAKKCHEIYLSKNLPNRFKMTIGGCAYECLDYTINDFGVYPVKYPEINENNCLGCGRCPEVCKTKAITIEDKIAVIDENVCRGCGKCFEHCPNDAKEIKYEGYQLYIGGKGVRGLVEGCPLQVDTEEEILETLNRVLDLMKKYSVNSYERLSTVMERVGKEKFMEELSQ